MSLLNIITSQLIDVIEWTDDSRDTLSYRWSDAVPGFDMPIRVTVAPGRMSVIRPTARWQTAALTLTSPAEFRVDPNFYVTVMPVLPPPETRR